MLLKAAMLFNFNFPEFLSHHEIRKNRVSRLARLIQTVPKSAFIKAEIFCLFLSNNLLQNIRSFVYVL